MSCIACLFVDQEVRSSVVVYALFFISDAAAYLVINVVVPWYIATVFLVRADDDHD